MKVKPRMHIPVLPGMFGLVFGTFGMLLYDGQKVWESGMLQGYSTITWAVVILQVTPLFATVDE